MANNVDPDDLGLQCLSRSVCPQTEKHYSTLDVVRRNHKIKNDQSRCCSHEETLGGCPGRSESLLSVHSFCWFCHVVAQILFESEHSKTYKIK